MKTVLTILSIAVLTLGLAGCSSAPNQAESAIAVSGNWTDCNLMVNSQAANGNTIFTVSITESFTGALSGSWVGTEWDVVRADNSGTFQGVGVFTGSAGQHSGSAVMSYSGSFDASGSGKAQWAMYNGTEGLQSLTGQGTFTGSAGSATKDCAAPFAGTYTGQIRFSQ